MLNEIVEAIHRLKARRLVIDSLSGFELALAPTFREDFRESLYRMVAVLTGMGITMMMTAELEDSYMDLRFSPHGTAFLTDAIIMQRYIELKGQLQRIMAVVKVRGSAHSKDLRAFEITEDGIVMGETLGGYEGLLTGSPELIPGAAVRARKRTRRRGHADDDRAADMPDGRPHDRRDIDDAATAIRQAGVSAQRQPRRRASGRRRERTANGAVTPRSENRRAARRGEPALRGKRPPVCARRRPRFARRRFALGKRPRRRGRSWNSSWPRCAKPTSAWSSVRFAHRR